MSDLATPGPRYDDDRNVRWALAIALALHAVLFSLQVPGMTAQVHPPPEKHIFLVTPTPYMPPKPETRETLPQEQPVKVPVPDPTPDDPEPIRPPEEIEVDLDLPLSDALPLIPEPPPVPETPLIVGGAVEPPVRIHSPAPRYTEIARRARIEGSVIVSAVIEKDGRVASAEILKALPMGLDQAAVDAVRRWTFEPATLHGEPVAVFYNLTVHFKLN